MATLFLGIDVSREKLDFAYLQGDVWQSQVVDNEAEAIEKHLQSLLQTEGAQWHAIVEATGTYSAKIVYACAHKGVPLTLINPNQSAAFARMKHKTTKNDRADARLLAQYGQINQSDLPVYQLPDATKTALRQLLIALEQIEKMRQQTLNRRHAYAQLPDAQRQKLIESIFDANIQSFDDQIKQLQAEIDRLIPPEDDYEESKKLITSVVGIGKETATAMLAKTNGIKKFGSAKQLAKFIGLAPTEKQSGSSVKSRGHINKSGNKTLRKALYCATWSAVRFNNACKNLYQRLRAKGKPTKLALIAVANLLVRQIYATIKHQKPFDNQYFLKTLH